MSCRVVLAGDEGVPGYDVSSASSLFVIDRRGLLAGVPDEFYSRFQEGLNRRLPDLLSGATAGPVLWALETRPKGWRELWRVPDVTHVVAVAVAPATSRGPLEIGVLDGSRRLRRYAADGSPLGEGTLDEGGSELRGADLDGDGENEWLVWDNYATLTVVDSRGQAYWSQYGVEDLAALSKFEVGGVADLDGDGYQEIVLRSEDSVTALRAVGQRQWVYRSGQPLSHVMVDARGGIWAQSDRGLFPIDGLGRAGSPVLPSFGELLFRGQIVGARGEPLRVYASRRTQVADIDHDLDGDGREDVLMTSRGGVSAYDGDGKTILSLSIQTAVGVTSVALADLDGRPGDEMVVFIPQYGLIALGRGDRQVAAK